MCVNISLYEPKIRFTLIVRFLVELFSAHRRACSKYWPSDVLGAWITNWLFMYRETFLPIVIALAVSQIASMAPIISASYVLWSSGDPRYDFSDLRGVILCFCCIGSLQRRYRCLCRSHRNIVCKSASSIASELIDFFLVLSMTVFRRILCFLEIGYWFYCFDSGVC